MKRISGLAVSLSACFILTGCNDKIEEANAVAATAATPTTMTQPVKIAPLDSGTAQGRVEGSLKVADLYAQKNQLAGKTVTVEGNVVKVSEAIMGKNWIHIQDGSGSEGTNDIIFTSATQSATVGDHVVATGTVAIDKDFGYGYFYSVIVEEATFTK